MTFAPAFNAPPSPAAPSRAASLLDGISAVWLRWRARRDRAATAAALGRLDDRALHDLGLARSEIESVVHDETGDHLRRYEPGWRNSSRKPAADWI